MARKSALAGVLSAACLLSPSVARGAERVELTWDAPGCSTATEVLAEVNRILGDAPKLEKRIEVVASVTRTTTGLVLSLTTRIGDAVDHRAAEDDSCVPIRDAAALMIALSVEAARERGEPARPVARPRAPRRVVEEPARAAPPDVRRHVAVGGGPISDLGTLGGLTNGFELHAQARQPYALVELFGAMFLPHEAAAPGSRAGIRVRLAAAGARACLPLPCGPSGCMVHLCASGELMLSAGDSFGVSVDLPGHAAWFGWGPGVRWVLPVAGVARLSLGAFGVFSVGAPRYALELEGLSHSILQPKYGARLAVGYEFDVL